MRMVWGFLATLAIVMCLAVSVSDTQADGTTTTVSFTELGAKSFTVPAGVTSIHVVAVGAPGGSEGSASGGMGGVATADVAVTPGEVLGVFVGGTGESGGLGEGGYNGGGDSVAGEGGGGASDVRVGDPGSLLSRLVVAGGGGGAAVGSSSGALAGGSAGAAGGSSGPGSCTGGGGATATQAGAGGGGNRVGEAGHLGDGGFAPFQAGGGGGGGLFGGGGGGGYFDSLEQDDFRCGGGGGSSGFGLGTSATSVGLAPTTQQPSVTITYTVPAPETPGSGGAPSGPSGGSSGGSNGGSNGSSPGSPGVGTVPADLSLTKIQHGKAVTAAVQVPAADSVLEAKLLWQQTRASKQLVFGRLTQAHLKKGLHSFTVRLIGRGKKKLDSLGTLKMILAVDIDPPQGPDGVASRRVKLKSG